MTKRICANFFQGLEENTCLLQPALKNTAPAWASAEGGKGGEHGLPWIFVHETANVFFIKHSFCENTPSLTNRLSSFAALVDVKNQE